MRMTIKFENDEYQVLHIDATNDPYSQAVTFAEALAAAGHSAKTVLEALEHALLTIEEEILEAADHMDQEEEG